MGLSPELLRGISGLGFETPTPIQQQVIPAVLENNGRDIIGLAQTGTGKTAAFGLPILQQTDVNDKTVQALIITPTRELCIQIAGDLNKFGKHIKGLKVAAVYGGANIDSQIKQLRAGVHVIAATPGRMLDLIKRKVADISNIRTLVLDEADEMLNMGFREELDAILENAPENRRTLLFSATMPADVARIANNYMKNPLEITVGKQNSGAENVRHIYYQVHARDRYLALKRIVDANPDIYGIIFCRTRMETKDVADKLMKDGYHADALHGDLSQSQRDQVMKRFRTGALQMLVATDVAARGLDVSDITHIINYNLPQEAEIYTHRSGRTGRAGKSGVSIAIIHYKELGRVRQIEKMIGKKFEQKPVPTGEEICKKQLFNLIDRMEKAEVDEEQISPFMDVVNKKLAWLTKEDVIKKFVSLEFNRFSEYYKNASDLNKKAENDSKQGEKQSFGKSSRYKRKEKGNFARLFLNVGRKDNMSPQRIIGMINDYAKDRDINIGEIDIKDNFSFVEVGDRYKTRVIKALSGKNVKGRKLEVELSQESENRKKKSKKKKRF